MRVYRTAAVCLSIVAASVEGRVAGLMPWKPTRIYEHNTPAIPSSWRHNEEKWSPLWHKWPIIWGTRIVPFTLVKEASTWIGIIRGHTNTWLSPNERLETKSRQNKLPPKRYFMRLRGIMCTGHKSINGIRKHLVMRRQKHNMSCRPADDRIYHSRRRALSTS